ncbi:hypothetical protein [Paraburkholderia sp. BL9I2N2]|jgi:hypothetical protein|uniref:hypothetical protein n=1 Tax=Paraburkholderia sp. BL9I2N2 TaxID=1938809 RepID=UPI0010449D40|nr:hypothetical protein [Paraburkholderia sp. BL9I2N2]TCK95594.1 hypothetical protein B0G74_2221 [Paraburkholderia sp. BL9I2N2]
MDDLLSLKGLITISIASLVSIKALRVNFRVSRDINVEGNGDIVIVNEKLAPTQRSFKLLWQMLVLAIVLTYPVLGLQYNFVLGVLAIIGTPLAVISLIVTVRGYGMSRLSDIFYVIGTALSCWLAICSHLYLANTANSASRIYPTIGYLSENGLPNLGLGATWTGIVLPLMTSCLSVVGFAALLLSLLYFMSAYLTARHFDDSARFLLHYGAMAIVGFLAACDALAAFAFHDFAYIGRLLGSVLTV